MDRKSLRDHESIRNSMEDWPAAHIYLAMEGWGGAGWVSGNPEKS